MYEVENSKTASDDGNITSLQGLLLYRYTQLELTDHCKPNSGSSSRHYIFTNQCIADGAENMLSCNVRVELPSDGWDAPNKI
jgi:hypothetical protein